MNKGKFTKGRRTFDSMDRFYQNETRIIAWIYNWGFSIPGVLRVMLGLKAKVSTLRVLFNQQKVTRADTFLRFPPFAYYLTPQGVSIAEARLEKNVNYQEGSKDRVVTPHFFHDLVAQALTLVALRRGVAVDYSTPRMMGFAGKEDTKIPDAIWQTANDLHVAIEVETEQKWDKKLDNFMAKTIESIESGEIYECLIVSPSRATVRNYLKALDRVEIPLWSKKSGGVWRLERNVIVRDEVRSRLSILFVPEQDLHSITRKLVVAGDLEAWMNSRSFGNTDGLE